MMACNTRTMVLYWILGGNFIIRQETRCRLVCVWATGDQMQATGDYMLIVNITNDLCRNSRHFFLFDNSLRDLGLRLFSTKQKESIVKPRSGWRTGFEWERKRKEMDREEDINIEERVEGLRRVWGNFYPNTEMWAQRSVFVKKNYSNSDAL